MVVQRLRVFDEPFALAEQNTPFLRQTFRAIEGAGQLAVDCAGGVGVISQVDGEEKTSWNERGPVEGPEGGFERFTT